MSKQEKKTMKDESKLFMGTAPVHPHQMKPNTQPIKMTDYGWHTSKLPGSMKDGK